MFFNNSINYLLISIICLLIIGIFFISKMIFKYRQQIEIMANIHKMNQILFNAVVEEYQKRTNATEEQMFEMLISVAERTGQNIKVIRGDENDR